ncbi:hypothetical protein [Mycolicibacterium sp. XJ870]
MIEKPVTPHADEILGPYWENNLKPGLLSDRSVTLSSVADGVDSASLDGQVNSNRMFAHGDGTLVTAMSTSWQKFFVQVGDIGSQVGQAAALLAAWAATLNGMLTKMAGVVWAAEALIDTIEASEATLIASGQDPEAMVRMVIVEAQEQVVVISAAAAASLAALPDWAGTGSDGAGDQSPMDMLVGDWDNLLGPAGDAPASAPGQAVVSQDSLPGSSGTGGPAAPGNGVASGADTGTVTAGNGAPGNAVPTGVDGSTSAPSTPVSGGSTPEAMPTANTTADLMSGSNQGGASITAPGNDAALSEGASSSAGPTTADQLSESGHGGMGVTNLSASGVPLAAASSLAAASASAAVAPVSGPTPTPAPTAPAPVAPPMTPLSPVTGSALLAPSPPAAVPGAAVPAAISPTPVVAPTPVVGTPVPAVAHSAAGQTPMHAGQSSSNSQPGTGQPTSTAPVPPPIPFVRGLDDSASVFVGPLGGQWAGAMMSVTDRDLAALQWVVESAGGGGEVCWAAGMLVTDARRQIVVTTDRGRSWLPRRARLPADIVTPWTHADCTRWEGLRDPARVVLEYAAAIPGATLSALVSSATSAPALAAGIPFAFVHVPSAARSQVAQVSRQALGVSPQHQELADNITEPEQQRKQALWLAFDAVQQAELGGPARTIVDTLAAQPRPNNSADLGWQQLNSELDRIRSLERLARLDVRDVAVGELDTGGGPCRQLLVAAYATEAVAALSDPDARQALEDALYCWSMLMELITAKETVSP